MRIGWRQRFAAYGGTALLGIAVVAGIPGAAHAAPTTVTATCTPDVGAPFTQDFTYDLSAQTSGNPADTPVTVTINPHALNFAAPATSVITQYHAIGGTFVGGSATQTSGATDANGPVTEAALLSGDIAQFSIDGPVAAGAVTTAGWTVQVLPDAGSPNFVITDFVESYTANGIGTQCLFNGETLLSVDFLAPTTTTLPPTTTTLATTTTTVQAQHPISSSATDLNNCGSHLQPLLQPDAQTKISVTLSTTAFPQPHKGDPIALTNTKATLNIPATLLQVGVDAGLIKNGDSVPSVVTIVVNGKGTTQGSHTYKISTTAHIVVSGGKAQPINSTFALPNTTWTPSSATGDVFFSQKSMLIVSTIDLGPSVGIVTATFTCSPSKAPVFIALGATGTASPPTGPGSPGSPGGPTTPGGNGSTVGGSANELPRTGGMTIPLLILAFGCIELGILALRAGGRLRGRALND